MNEIVKLGLDIYHGTVPTEFASHDANEKMREALIEVNNGKTTIDLHTRGANREAVFAIIEQIINISVEEGLKGDEFFMNLVDYRNMAEGDLNEFVADEKTTFIVSEIARGILTPRRQRIGEKSVRAIPTSPKAVRVYEEMARILAGRVSWNDFVSKVTDSVLKKRYEDLYTIFSGIGLSTPGMGATYYQSGTYNEENLLTMVEHVEAANGSIAQIVGTKKALRKIVTATLADEQKTNYYNLGFFGKVAGVDMIAVPQRHKTGTETFVFPEDRVYILGSSDKPVKYVTEGNPIVLDKDPLTNDDLTQEYYYIEQTGAGLMIQQKMGVYVFA